MTSVTNNTAAGSKFTQFANDLRPLKAVIHGPPAAGKTSVAKRLCKHYGARYVSVRTMIEDTLNELRQNILNAREQAATNKSKSPESEDEDVEDEEVDAEEEAEGDNMLEAEVEIHQYEEQIQDINALLSGSPDHKLPDDYVVRLMRVFLAKPICQTHGYVLDGFPKVVQQARELFGQAAEVPKDPGEATVAKAEEAPGEGQIQMAMGNANVNITPDFVVSLQADDEFLCRRIMKLPEKEIQGTHYDEENMIRRLLEFRSNNSPDNTVLNFFDEAEIHPIVIDITEHDDIECVLSYLYKTFGPPVPGLGLSNDEEEELRIMEAEARRLKQEAYLIEKQLAEETTKRDYEDKMEQWAQTLEQLQMEEEKIIAAEAEPLRFYLMNYVFPTLTKGLSEIAKIKPDDPIDYLAEFLFKENPEGKMFDPSFTRSGEEILKLHESVVQNV